MMATQATPVVSTTNATPPVQAPAPGAPPMRAPAASAIKSNMDTLASLKPILNAPVQRAKAAMQRSHEELSPLLAENQKRQDNDQRMLTMYSQRMNQITQAMQRQRLVTINRAQILRKVLPVIGIFSLIAGAADGMSGAISALAGGLAGLSKGLNDQYDKAWKQYTTAYDHMMQHAKDTQAEMKSIMEDGSKTAQQKIDLMKIAAGSDAGYRKALDAHDNKYVQVTMQATERDNQIKRVEALHALAKKANRPASATESRFAVDLAFPFTPAPPATVDYTKLPEYKALKTSNPTLYAQLQAAPNMRAQVAENNGWKIPKQATEAQQRANHYRQHEFIGNQIATIANVVGAVKGWDQDTGLEKTTDWLRTNGLLDSPSLDTQTIEEEMEEEPDSAFAADGSEQE